MDNTLSKPCFEEASEFVPFQPTTHAIKIAIMKQCLEKNRRRQQHNAHVGGLPSPPVEQEEEEVVKEEEEKEVKIEPVVTLPTSNEIRAKIQRLTDEKHRLFQMLRQLMLQEELQKKKQLQQQKRQQQQFKKKSRWAPPSSSDNNQSSYFYPRPRYQPYQQRPHYSVSRTPFSG